MRVRRFGPVVAFALLVLAWGLVASGAFAAPKTTKPTSVQATSVDVLAGAPVPFAVQLSRTEIRPGTVVFTVTNKGSLRYAFEVCSGGGHANVCWGKTTPLLNPGEKVKLTTKLGNGPHEFILTSNYFVTQTGTLTVTPAAAAGTTTKVTSPHKSSTTSTPSTTTPAKPSTPTTPSTPGPPTTTTPTAPAPGGATLIGDPVAGATVFKSAGCGSCHTLKAAGSTGTAGPNLDQIAPDQPTVVTNVTYGNALGMPAFGGAGGSLSATQINNVAAYVYSSTHSG